jgi:hypothetical protein
MALSKFGKRDVARMAKMLDPEYGEVAATEEMLPLVDEFDRPMFTQGVPILSDDEEAGLEDMALAALNEALEIIQGKAKWMLCAQLEWSQAGGYLTPEEAAKNRIGLSWYTTELQAIDAGKKLAFSMSTLERFRFYVVPVHMGTPASFHKKRKEERDEALAQLGPTREAELQRRVRWLRDNPGQPSPPEWLPLWKTRIDEVPPYDEEVPAA